MKIKIFNIVILLSIILISCTNKETQIPIIKNKFSTVTNYTQLINFVNDLSSPTSIFKLSFPFSSVEKRKIPLISFTSENSEIKILLFGTQHGNEHSGKEALLGLIKYLNSNYIQNFSNLDIFIFPIINPDGAENDKRRNANGKDLNRDHLLLTQPETIGLHNVISEINPDLSFDIHEYNPLTESWLKYGAVKDFDIQVGTLTNPNVPSKIIELQKIILSDIEKKLYNLGYSFHEYIVGGPPDIRRIRHSTTDIDDGRQSIGITGKISFIIEGKNGKNSNDNLKRRYESQLATITTFLFNISENVNIIKSNLKEFEEHLFDLDSVTIRSDHIFEQNEFLKLKSIYTDTDTIIQTDNYHTNIISKLKIEVPEGYLFNSDLKEVLEIVHNNKFDYQRITFSEESVFQYTLKDYILEKLEDNEFKFFDAEKDNFSISGNYIFVPTNNQNKVKIISLFEPNSMYGLINFSEYNKNLIKDGKYLIFRK